METSNISYPSATDVECEEKALQYLPQSLKLLLQGIIRNEDGVKIASIGQVRSLYKPPDPELSCSTTVGSGHPSPSPLCLTFTD